MARVGIALGSNLGDRRARLQQAIRELTRLSVEPESVLVAPIYQTQPRFCPPGSPNFLNTVIDFAYHGSPQELLKHTQALELQIGRVLSPTRNAPRAIDIDLLYMGDLIESDEQLILPHPRLHERRFVLEPLAAIRPDLVLPTHRHTIQALLDGLVTDEPALEIIE